MGIAENARQAATELQKLNDTMQEHNRLQQQGLAMLEAHAGLIQALYSGGATRGSGGSVVYFGGASRGASGGGGFLGNAQRGASGGGGFLGNAQRGASGGGGYRGVARGGEPGSTGRFSYQNMDRLREALERLLLITDPRNYAAILRMLGGL